MRLAHWVALATAALSFLTPVRPSPSAKAFGATGHGYRTTTIISAPPNGTIELASYGVIELGPDRLARMQTLHVRFSLINRSAEPWNIDLRRFTLAVRDHELSPLFVNSDTLGLPLAVVLGDHRRRIFDAFYAVPPGIDPRGLRELAARWEITVGDHRHVGRTVLVRDERVRALLEPGRGNRWWADPTYPWPQFYRRPGPIMHRPPTTVTVHPEGER